MTGTNTGFVGTYQGNTTGGTIGQTMTERKKWSRVENYAIFIILKPFRARPGLIQEIVKNVAILARTCPQLTHVLSKAGDSCFC